MGRQQKDVNQDQAKWRLPSLLHHCVDSEYLQCKPTCRNDDNCLWTVPVLDALICNGQANIITGWKESNSIWPNRSETVQPSSHPQPPPPPLLCVFRCCQLLTLAGTRFWHCQLFGHWCQVWIWSINSAVDIVKQIVSSRTYCFDLDGCQIWRVQWANGSKQCLILLGSHWT